MQKTECQFNIQWYVVHPPRSQMKMVHMISNHCFARLDYYHSQCYYDLIQLVDICILPSRPYHRDRHYDLYIIITIVTDHHDGRDAMHRRDVMDHSQ